MFKLSKDKATTLAYRCLDEKVPLSLIEKALYVMEEAYLMGQDDADAKDFIKQNPEMILYPGQIGYLENFCQEKKIPEKYIDAVIAVSELAYNFGTVDAVFNRKENQLNYILDFETIARIANKRQIAVLSSSYTG